ncbi:MAG: sensor histidine kinase [Calothrix sp. MO_167.B12]|nr:sensor histidine kinase [Calothrix sp. MO_167.B12]
MQRLIWKKHPFRLLFYLELTLLGISLLAAFSPLPPHRFHLQNPPNIPDILIPITLPSLGFRFRPIVIPIIAALAALGLRLPFGSRVAQVMYTSLGFGLSWLAVLLGGRGERVFPSLLLVVVIRACLMFPWKGRILVAIAAYGSFLMMLFMSFIGMTPFGIPLGRRLPRLLRRMPDELVQPFLINLKLNSALLFALVLMFVLLLVGTLLAEKQSRQQLSLANRRLREYALLIENQATLQERNRIAREIHDSVGHSLTAQSIQLENVAMLLDDEDVGQATQNLQKARQLGKEALQNVRQSVATLRNHPLGGQSLTVAVTKLVQECEKTNGIQINSEINLSYPLSTEISTAIYRVIQEALTNISKHSHADKVRLILKEKTTGILVSIKDNGQGFNPQENTTGFGLQGMRERIEVLGGHLHLTSQLGKGCKIQFEIPLSADENPSFTG